MEDIQIVELYWHRNEKAIAETSAKYGRSLHGISMGILRNGEDCKECVNDTYMNAWNSMPPQKPESLFAFLGRIVRNLSINLYTKNHAKKRGGSGIELLLSELSDCVPDNSNVENTVETAELGRYISEWLLSIEKSDRVLFMRRYWFCEAVKEIAFSQKLSENQLAGKLFRLRGSLKRYLEEEGVYI